MAPKSIAEFPRPPRDNGRGVHWSAYLYHPTGAELLRWVNELKAMQIKWVKVLDDGGGSSLELCQTLLAHEMMPIVRLFRERPNPDRVGGREIDTLKRLTAAGVSYFETNNEPDLPAEWNGSMPRNWLDIVVDNFIYDADVILSLGGLPALPAMGPGSKDNAISRVVAKGRKDIFERGGWVAIHNYTLNHPPDYPNDAVNQAGKPLTPAEYAEAQRWQYSHLAWDEVEAKGLGISRNDYEKYQRWAWGGRPIEEINALRAQKKNPGHTIDDDPNCFRGYERFGGQIHEALGFHVPVISTEGGPVVGWDDDKRYPKVTPNMHAKWTLELCRFMQDDAPEWYFANCTWLVASKPLGDFSPTWDQMSWYTNAWDLQFGLNGQLPVVQMLKDTPASVRHELRTNEDIPAAVDGTVSDAAGEPLANIPLSLRQAGKVIARGVSDDAGRFRLPAPPGQYNLWVDWVGPVVRHITLGQGDVDTFDIPGLDPAGDFTIAGEVKDTGAQPRPGVSVELRRQGVAHAIAITDAKGAFTFRPKVGGVFAIGIAGDSAEVTVNAAAPRADVVLTAPDAPLLRYTLTGKRLLPPEETNNRNLFYGVVSDAQGKGLNGVTLEMRWANAAPNTTFPRVKTGSDASKPAGYFEFLHSSGVFLIEVLDEKYASDVADDLDTANVPGRVGQPICYEITFQLRGQSTQAAQSVVSGTVSGGRLGQTVRLWGGGQSREATLDANRNFRIEGIAAGVYNLELTGIGMIATDLVLDGENEKRVEFALLGALVGSVVNASSRAVTLISETHGFTRRSELTAEDHYRFTNLPPGLYRIEVGDAILSAISNDGQSVTELPVLDAIAGVGAPIRQSKISGRVLTAAGSPMAGRPLQLLLDAQIAAHATTDDNGSFIFTGLAAGVYALTLQNQLLANDLQVDGWNQIERNLVWPGDAGRFRTLGRYYLLGMADASLAPALVRLLAPWLSSQPSGAVGVDPAEAQRAATVVAIGDGISDAVIANLQSVGIEVIDMRSDLITLAQRLQS